MRAASANSSLGDALSASGRRRAWMHNCAVSRSQRARGATSFCRLCPRERIGTATPCRGGAAEGSVSPFRMRARAGLRRGPFERFRRSPCSRSGRLPVQADDEFAPVVIRSFWGRLSRRTWFAGCSGFGARCLRGERRARQEQQRQAPGARNELRHARLTSRR